MANLPDVKKRISSTQNTRKITQAMQLVAANKMRGFQKKALASRSYAVSLLDGLHQAHASFDNISFGKKRERGKVLFVLLTSDKGLAGSLNVKLIDGLFKSETWTNTPESERLLITIGKKAADAARRREVKLEKSFDGLPEDMNPLNALEVIDQILKYWEDETCREIILIAPHYINAFSSQVTQKKYLPFDKKMLESHFEWHKSEQEAEKKN